MVISLPDLDFLQLLLLMLRISSDMFSGTFFFAALHMAAANGHLDIVDYLIGRGAVRIPSFSFDRY